MNKESIKRGINGVTDKTKEIANKSKKAIVKMVDQNEDSTLDKEDFNLIKNKVADKTQKTMTKVKTELNEKKKELDIKRLKPVNYEDIESTEFNMPKIICVSDLDKKYVANEVCQNSIGRYLKKNDVLMLNIFREYLSKFNIEFYPNDGGSVYFMDPIDRNKYISLKNYFSYISAAYVRELRKIACDLGASYFEVVLMEEKNSASKEGKEIESKGNYSGVGAVNVKTKKKKESSEMNFIEIKAKDSFDPQEPKKPKLKYLKNDEDIIQLIDFRMNKKITEEELSINLATFSGIKESDVSKIDGAFKIMKLNTNLSFEAEYQNECRKYLKYIIRF